MNKKMLAVAILGGLFSTSAFAGVNISAGGTPVIIADELVAPPNKNITNASARLDLQSQLGYNFVTNEERYVRLQCADHINFGLGTAVTITNPTNYQVGPVNGIGTNAITFSVRYIGTAPTYATATDVLNVVGDRTLELIADGSCTYGLYDLPSQAATDINTSTNGRISSFTGAYIDADKALVFTSGAGSAVANVESPAPAYSAFLVDGTTAPDNGTVTRALAEFTFGAKDSPGNYLDYDGNEITTVDMLTPATRIVVDGDFSARAVNGVYLAENADCAGPAFTTGTVNTAGNQAVFIVGQSDRSADSVFLCYTTNGTTAIQASTYTANYDVTANVGYDPQDIGPLGAGSVTRNGTELQATLTQQPTGWLSRIAVTNDSTQVRQYFVKVLLENGNTATTSSGGNLNPGLNMINVSNLVSGFSGGPRATIILNVAAPDRQIQAMYQLVEPTKGAITNAQMVRPGTN